MPGRYLSIGIKEVYIWQLYAHFVVMNFVLCWTLQFHTILVVNKIYVVSNIAVVWTNMTTEYAWNSLKNRKLEPSYLVSLWLGCISYIYCIVLCYTNESLVSVFIFPQGYTRLKYWSTRQGRVVFLVLQKHPMQTTTINHNPMMRPSMKMTPGQTGNNTLLHKKRAQWKMSFKYICKMTFFLDKRISTFYNGGGCTLLNTLCFRVWQGIYLQHLHQL